jgi:hypothetical protein
VGGYRLQEEKKEVEEVAEAVGTIIAESSWG